MAETSSGQSDRDLQDAVITYLADASLRRTGAGRLPLSPEQAQRAGKFARFLARRYYRDRLARSFRYSRRFGPAAETLVDTSAFDRFLEDCILGSVQAAERVGDMAAGRLSALPAPGPWWDDLLKYERLFFMQAAVTENVRPLAFFQVGASACCRRFSWGLPELLPRLKAGQPVGDELRHEVTLLFARTRQGRIYVVEVNEATAAVFEGAQARLSPAQISVTASLPVAVVHQALAALAQVGAVVTPE